MTVYGDTEEEAIAEANQLMSRQIFAKKLGDKKYVNRPPRGGAPGRLYKLISAKIIK